MVYYGVSFYPFSTTDGEVSITKLANKDEIIEWMGLGFSPDHQFVADSMREVKELLSDFLPDYKFKRSDMRAAL